jgi:tetratricopeptide (TPR) repeat protein
MSMRVAAFSLGLLAGAGLSVGTADAASGGGSGGGPMSPSASAPQYDAAAEYRKGLEALKANDFKSAERAFGHVLEVAPDNAPTLVLYGMAKAGQDDLKGARKAYEKAVRKDPKLILGRRELAVTLVKLGEVDKARAELEALKTRQAACGDICPDAAELKAAIEEVENALGAPAAGPVAPAGIAQAPSLMFAGADRGDGAYWRAVSLINEGRYPDALGALHAAEAAWGPHPDILTYLGYANRKLGRYDEAERYYRQALAVAPAHRGATEYYGELKVERGDFAGAESMLSRLDAMCDFGCAEAEELRRWIDRARSPGS